MIRGVQKGAFGPPRAVDPSIDRALEAVCLKAMADKPDDRYASPKSLAELILTQMKTALEAAGSDPDHVLKCNVLCISKDRFKTFNEIYKRFFPTNPPARIFFCVPEWTGPFDIEIDCIALTKS